MLKKYPLVIISIIALASYLSGYWICMNTDHCYQFGGDLYVIGLVWFYGAWALGFIQLIFGVVQYFQKKEARHHIIAGSLVLALQATIFALGAAGVYLTV